MGVILFIMVTGTLPYLGEANIKDPLYQYIKSKSPNDFWHNWKKMFKSEMDEKEDQNGEDIVQFTSDEDDISQNIELSADKSLIFRVWIEFLYKISYGFKIVFLILNLIIQPVWFVGCQLFLIFKNFYKSVLSIFTNQNHEETSSPILKIGWENC